MTVTATSDSRELVIVRELKAPREAVFAAWADPARAAKWWAPAGFVLLSCEMDVRPGGRWHRRMRTPAGAVIVKHGTYREVAPPERLVFTYITENEAGVVDPETVVNLGFVDLGGNRTRLTLWHTGFDTEPARDDHRGGWAGAVERLAGFCESPSPRKEQP